MRRIHVQPRGPLWPPCPVALERAVADVMGGVRYGVPIHVVTGSRAVAEALAQRLSARGVMGVHLAGDQLEIHPDRLH